MEGYGGHIISIMLAIPPATAWQPKAVPGGAAKSLWLELLGKLSGCNHLGLVSENQILAPLVS